MPTYQLIQTQVVGSGGASSISFSGIPSTYTDLEILLSLRATSGNAVSSYIATINGSSYSGNLKTITSDGGAAYSATSVAFFTEGSGYTANTFSSVKIYIPNYTSSINKTIFLDFVNENNASPTGMGLTAYSIQVTSSISGISFSCDNSFVQYSTAYLYGIKNS